MELNKLINELINNISHRIYCDIWDAYYGDRDFINKVYLDGTHIIDFWHLNGEDFLFRRVQQDNYLMFLLFAYIEC